MAIEKNIIVETKDVGPVREKKNIKLAKKPLPKDWQPNYLNGNVIDITPLIDDEWWKIRPKTNGGEEDEAQGIKSLNVFSRLASAKDDFDFYYQVLSKYYTPSDLFGKSLKQLDQMLQMFVREDGGLI
jgi:hypothetical protein